MPVRPMDDVTAALRKMYEEFPYPPNGTPEQRVAWDARLLLSYGERRPPSKGRLTALDAGCGRGAGTLGAATLQPDVAFVGADMNGVALKEATQAASARGLKNVRFQEVDLTTLEGLDVPSGGFDVIFSSGVVHHMPDPAAGLAKLRGALAPHGMVQLMVYGRHGRAPLYRLAHALDLLIPRAAPLRDRLMVGQQLARTVPVDAIGAGPWGDVAKLDDVEFVDRYLNVNETSYDIPGLFGLLEAAGLRFLRWTEPTHWSLEPLLGRGPLRDLAARLPPREQFALVDQLAWRPKLELVACHVENGPRPLPVDGAALAKGTLAVSPEVSFRTDVRCTATGHRIEHLSIELRRGTRIPVAAGPLATAVLVIKELTGPVPAEQLVRALQAQGVGREPALATLLELVRAEVLYTP